MSSPDGAQTTSCHSDACAIVVCVVERGGESRGHDFADNSPLVPLHVYVHHCFRGLHFGPLQSFFCTATTHVRLPIARAAALTAANACRYQACLFGVLCSTIWQTRGAVAVVVCANAKYMRVSIRSGQRARPLLVRKRCCADCPRAKTDNPIIFPATINVCIQHEHLAVCAPRKSSNSLQTREGMHLLCRQRHRSS